MKLPDVEIFSGRTHTILLGPLSISCHSIESISLDHLLLNPFLIEFLKDGVGKIQYHKDTRKAAECDIETRKRDDIIVSESDNPRTMVSLPDQFKKHNLQTALLFTSIWISSSGEIVKDHQDASRRGMSAMRFGAFLNQKQRRSYRSCTWKRSPFEAKEVCSSSGSYMHPDEKKIRNIPFKIRHIDTVRVRTHPTYSQDRIVGRSRNIRHRIGGLQDDRAEIVLECLEIGFTAFTRSHRQQIP